MLGSGQATAAMLLMAAGLLAAPGAGRAQTGFGDAELSFRAGIVYDDDAVPGGGLNEPYLDESVPRPGTGAGGAFVTGPTTLEGLRAAQRRRVARRAPLTDLQDSFR